MFYRSNFVNRKVHFVHGRFLRTSDTWWNNFTTRMDWPRGFKTLAAKAGFPP
jgi:hypothetical protein